MLQKYHFGVNPIIVKELRSRMRDARAFITLTVVLLLLGGSSYLLYRLTVVTSAYSMAPLSPQIGQSMFIALAFLELMMVSAIAPAVTAGAISGEREKLTYEMLLATPLRPGSILWGKLISALSYVFLLIFAAIPMASLIFIFGGVTVRDMIKVLVILVTVAITLGLLGMFMSTWLGRTARATVVSYIFVAALYVLPVVAYIATGILRQAEPPRWLLVPSPMSALFSAVTNTAGGAGMGSWNFFWSLGMGLGGNLSMLSGASISQTGIPRPLYHYSLPLFAFMGLIFYMLSTRLVLPTQRWRIKAKELLIAFGVLLIAAGLVAGAFLLTANRYENASIFSIPPIPQPVGMVERAVEARAIPAKEIQVEEVTRSGTSDTKTEIQPSDSMVDNPEVVTAIYSAVVRQLYNHENPLGSTSNSGDQTVVYLVRQTDDGVGDPDGPFEQSKILPDEVQSRILDALTGPEAEKEGLALPVNAIWTDQVQTDRYSQKPSQTDVTIVLGNLHPTQENSIRVSAAIYSSDGASGQTFILSQGPDGWQVTGNTGTQWRN